MNPFDWSGPQYLVFYSVLMVVVCVGARVLRRRLELDGAAHGGVPVHDPYAIAFLRGGKPEMVRVAAVSLIDRGMLAVKEGRLASTALAAKASRRIEQDLLAFCAEGRESRELFTGTQFDAAAAELEQELTRMRLLPDAEIKAMRRKLFWAGAAVLLLFGIGKVGVAIWRGRSNVEILLGLTFVSVFVLVFLVRVGRTARGDAFLREMENLFASLKLRSAQLRPGGAASEVAMLAAVWGVMVLPQDSFGWTRELFPQAAAAGGDAGASVGCGAGGASGGGGCGGCGGG